MSTTGPPSPPSEKALEASEAYEPHSPPLSSKPTKTDTYNNKNNDDNANDKDPEALDLTRTKSISEQLSPLHEFLFVGICVCAQFTTQVGLLQTLSIIHVIGDSFDISNPGVLSWLVSGYSLTVGSFVLIAGRLGDAFGYKRMLLIGYAWSALWSMIAGVAVYSNYVLFIFARVLAGIGPSICLTNGLAVLGATYNPGRKKSMAFAVFAASAPGGAVVGAVFAGLFSLAWWPWAFWASSIAFVGLTVATFFIVPDPPKRFGGKHTTTRELLWSLDPVGCVTGLTGLILVNFAWNQAGAVGWPQAYVYVTLILGVLFIGAFFVAEAKFTTSPLLPLEALTVDVGFVLGALACGWGSFGIWVYYLWQFLEVIKGLSPLHAAAWTVPVAVVGAIAATCTGKLLPRVGPHWIMMVALTCFTVGIVLVMTCPVDQTYWAQIFVCTLIIPWGMDMSFPAATIVVSDSVPREHQGIGSSLANTVVNYSIALALGFAGTVEAQVNNGGKTLSDVLKGYRGAFYVGVGLSGLGMGVCAVFLARKYIKGK